MGCLQVALVQWTESVGLTLVHRDLSSMTLRTPVTGATVKYEILQTFPFTSETKRMGIIVRVSVDGTSFFGCTEIASSSFELLMVVSVPFYNGSYSCC